MNLQKVVYNHRSRRFFSNGSTNHFSTFTSCYRFTICITWIEVQWMIAFLLITLIIATCRICSLGDKRFSRRLILIVRFRAYMKRTDFIFAFASAVTLSIRYYAIDWSSNISSNLARNVCIVVNGQFVFCKFLFLALFLNVCNTLVKYHVFPKPNINRLVCSVLVRNIVDSSPFLTVTRKFGVTFVDHGFDFL